jgi:predicted DNA-binding transcriptional regulator AlpA
MRTKHVGSYTSQEVAKLLKISVWSVYRMREAGIIVPLHLGLRSVRYAKADIDALAAGEYVRGSAEKVGAL